MPARHRLQLAVLGFVCVLACTATSALGANWHIRNPELSTLTSEGSITFEPRASAGAIACNVTLRGSFSSASFLTTATGSRFGAVTSATVSGCTNATVTASVEASRPWSHIYDGYTGSLPTSVNPWLSHLEGTKWLLSYLEQFLQRIQCQYTARLPLTWSTSGATREPAELGWIYALQDPVLGEGQAFSEFTALGGFRCPVIASIRGRFDALTRLTLRAEEEIVPSPLDFGRVATRSVTRKTVTIAPNTRVTIRSIAMRTGTSFTVSDPNGCSGRTFNGTTCDVTVTFTAPEGTGRSLEDTLVVETEAATITDTVRGST